MVSLPAISKKYHLSNQVKQESYVNDKVAKLEMDIVFKDLESELVDRKLNQQIGKMVKSGNENDEEEVTLNVKNKEGIQQPEEWNIF